MNESKHAQRVVEHFKGLLGEETCQSIDTETFDKLELMIESAIDASVLEAVNTAKGIANRAAHDISHIIEKI